MRVLYICRLFSGLVTSVGAGRWQPTGVPTIYKTIERLAAEADDLHLVLVDKDGPAATGVTGDWRGRLDGLDATVTVLARGREATGPAARIAGIAREIRDLVKVLRIAGRVRPDLIYIDHANSLPAGILARRAGCPVVYRVMGVYPAMRRVLTSARLRDRVLRWCYRAPFRMAICTQDGSGNEMWLDRALAPGVERHLLVNGIDPPRSEADESASPPIEMPAGRTIVLFLGKLEPAKGALEFADAFVAAARRGAENLHAVMIGTGSLAEPVAERFERAGLRDRATLVPRLAHAAVMRVLARADIYVSLNRLGNLSNANLEAFATGVAVIMPRSQPALGIDLATDRLIPENCAVRIASTDDIEGLAEAIGTLARDPARRLAMGGAVKEAVADIGTWDARIDREMALLLPLARSGARTDQT